MENKKMPLSLSIIILIIVNLIPIVGVISLGWTPMQVLIIYWMETLIIGIINVFKMFLAEHKEMAMNMLKLFMIPFFIVHFGLFVLVQGFFIIIVIPLVSNGDKSGELTENLLEALIEQTILGLWWPAVVLLGSHLFSFFWNFLGKKEYLKVKLGGLMFAPYSRVIIQQFIAIFGVIIAANTSSIVLVVVLVIIFKTAADAYAHLKEHRKLAKQAVRETEVQDFGEGREK